jgi:phosphate-selective porin OprO/OprP
MRNRLMTGTAFASLLLATPVFADDSAQKIQELQDEVQSLSDQISDLKRATTAEYTDVQNQRGQDIQFSLKNGRPSLKTADGDFTFEIRSLVQFDTAYYAQGEAPAGDDFSSGSNFRRARFGADGTVFKDWYYEFIYDFGGSGTEGSTISSAFIQYDGLAPFHWRIGAYAPPESFEDSTSASDLMFLERAQPTDLARGIAGADGRDATTIFAYGDDYFAAVSYTGGVVGDTAVFDEQQAMVGRAAYRIIDSSDVNLAIGADTTYVFKLADLTAGADSAHAFRLRERPELNVDSESLRLIDTGNFDASDVWEWGAEAAGNWNSLYAQGGYFQYDVTLRNSPLTNPNFDGWYVQASWVITGEAKKYRPERGAFGMPQPNDPFSIDHAGWGAWEVAGRYSDLDLNDNPGVANAPTPVGGVRGGEQHIWTAGVNWYPNNTIRFLLDYQHTDVSRLASAGTSLDAKLDAVSLRAQFAL